MPRLLLPILVALCLTSFATAGVDRVLRKFDFEERAAGNLEDVPMDWVKVEGIGLPHYVNGGLTSDQAYAGRYAFGFRLNGGSLVYRYPAGKIRAHGNAHYLIRVMAKTLALTNARARLTAYAADADGQPIRTSIVRSEPVSSDDWTPVELALDTPADAASIVLELGLLQAPMWRTSTLGVPAVYEQDIDAQAWFDDLIVSQVPQVKLNTSAPGNVFRRSEPAAIDVTLYDRVTDDLVGRLDVVDAFGRPVYQQTGSFDLKTEGQSTTGRVPLPSLPAGWYRATLAFAGNGRQLSRETVDFVRLPDDARALDPDPRFGVIATGIRQDAWDALPKLLPLTGAARVKLGVWTADDDLERGKGLFEQLVERLRPAGVSPTACLIAPPPEISRRLGGTDWAKLPRAPADAWQPALAGLVSRYAGYVDRWQFCDDARAADLAADPKLRTAYGTLLPPVRDLLGQGLLAMPWPIYADPPSPAPASLALNVPTDVLPEHVPLYVDGVKSPTTSLSLRLLDVESYGRAVQVRDLAQRIGFAVASKATRIDLPFPFKIDSSGVFQPTDTFLPARTLLTTLGGATYQGRMPLGDDIEALLFDRGGDGVLLVWTKSAKTTPRAIPIVLGNAPRVIDLDGNVSAVLRPRASDGTTDVVVGPTPTLLVGIDGALARLRSSFAFDNPLLESSYKPHVRRLKFVNPFPGPITGRLRLSGPPGWTLTPQSPTFSLNSGEAYDNAVTIEFPFSSTAGTKPVELSIQVDGGASFAVPLTLRLGLSELGVESSAFRDGVDVVVQQMITNYGTRPADYTAFASYPGSARQERMISGIAPGTTMIKRYRFTNVGTPSGKAVVRCGVRETQGTRVLTDEVPLQ